MVLKLYTLLLLNKVLKKYIKLTHKPFENLKSQKKLTHYITYIF
jgi:hypothetical protein